MALFGDKRLALSRYFLLPRTNCPVTRPRFTNKIVLFLVASAIALLATYLFWSLSAEVKALLEQRMGASPSPSADTIISAVKLFLVGIVGYLFVRALNSLFFALAFRLKRSMRPH